MIKMVLLLQSSMQNELFLLELTLYTWRRISETN